MTVRERDSGPAGGVLVDGRGADPGHAQRDDGRPQARLSTRLICLNVGDPQ
jgi:hypothetical protein